MENCPIKSVLIVGGGSAGWLSAGIIAARHGFSVDITLLESSELPTIGVGEGTWPTMKSTLQKMGISETDFFRECDVSFKQGAKFARWVTGENDDFYYHPLMLPRDFGHTNLGPYWQKNKSQSFSNTVCFQEALCEQALAPKTLVMPEYHGVANYAYHLDAGKFGSFLAKHCREKLNVKHIVATIDEVKLKDNGDIDGVVTADGQTIRADLFVDCSGLSSLLLGKTLGVPFVDKSDVLFIDKAIAVQCPYESEQQAIIPYTLSTAQQAGWVWDIGLTSRRGIGHVYSSRYMNDERALNILADYVGPQFDKLSPKYIDIPCGHREIFWKNNCVAVGMAAGFLEPLEASALVLVELSASFISEQLPESRSVMPIIAKRFNQVQTYRWDRIVDFLKLHYVLSKRTDSDFWIDNRADSTVPDSLKELLTLWRYQSPSSQDFPLKEEVFPVASYQYVLYGMGFEVADSTRLDPNYNVMATRLLAENQRMVHKALSTLPDNRELLRKIKTFGMKAI